MGTSKRYDKDHYVSCLTQQLSEFELLKAMYPNPNDVVLTDNKVLCEIQMFLENPPEYTPKHLDFTINLFLNSMKLEVCIDLPSLYPDEKPNIYVRCNQLNRQQETQLNCELSNHIQNNYLGEVCVYNAINWLQENIDNYMSSSANNDDAVVSNSIEKKFVRLWIYSHHIYNKKKREEIVKKARELKLTGFCLSGKPGIVCVEGPDFDCYDWWKNIKSMNWKKIVIRKVEEFISPQRKFENFEEIQLTMSDFSKYMDQKGLNQAFIDVFGLINDG